MKLFLQSAYLSSAIAVVYIALLYRSHPYRRLPVPAILSSFAVGMLTVIPVLVFYRVVPGLDSGALARVVLVAPVVEEFAKLAIFLGTVGRMRYPSLIDPMDYAIYFGVLGVGFAIYEDFWYIFGYSYTSWTSGDYGHFLEVFRWMVYARSFPGHVLFGALSGFVIGWALCQVERNARWRWLFGAFLVAVVSHALFNLAASQRGTLLLWSLVLCYVGIFLMLRRRVLAVSPFAALRSYMQGRRPSWEFALSPVETLFAEGFAWPGRARHNFLAFYPVTLSLVVLFPVMVSCVYFLHRLLSMGA